MGEVMGAKTKIEWADVGWHQKTAAKRVGVPIAEYVDRLHRGEKWCGDCKAWHGRDLFAKDRSRGDGLASSCEGRAHRKPKIPLTVAEKRARANASYRRCYVGARRAAIRARAAARKRGLDPIPSWWRDRQLERGCAYCEAPATTLDHVIPVVRGGKSHPGNLVPACAKCNIKKRHHDPTPWVERMRQEFIDQIGPQPLTGLGALEILGACA